MPTIESVGRQVVLSNSIKRHFDRDALQYAEQIEDEAKELVLEITESLLTGSVFNVVGEIGDLLVLLYQLCDDLGIDPAQAMQLKTIRNDAKYGSYICNNGYERAHAMKMSKDAWKAQGGDYKFSEIYLEYLSDDE